MSTIERPTIVHRAEIVLAPIWRWLRCIILRCPPTTVIALRHADVAGTGGDEDLSAAGQSRAQVLADMLRDAGVAAIYTSTLQRTIQTAAPLATALGIPAQQRNALDVAALAQEITDDHQGQTVVVVGHSNTTPDLLAELGATNPPAIAHDEFDNLFWLTLPIRSAIRLHHLHYGVTT